jgi:hypothetical protein
MKRVKKPYQTLDDVPRGNYNLVILCLKHDRTDLAEKLLRKILARIADIKVFEVYLLVRKLQKEAGVYCGNTFSIAK